TLHTLHPSFLLPLGKTQTNHRPLRDRLAVAYDGLEAPLANRANGRVVEDIGRARIANLDVIDRAVRHHGERELDPTLNAFPERVGRILRCDRLRALERRGRYDTVEQRVLLARGGQIHFGLRNIGTHVGRADVTST